ncbi:MAG: apolipoprotein N-acyltransferase [Gammaproteobacteria bacterium]
MKGFSYDALDVLIDAALLIDRHLLRERRTLWLLPIVIIAGLMAADAQMPADTISLFGLELPGGIATTILALMAYALLLHCAANAKSVRAAFWLGFVFGFVFFAVGLFWIFQALSGYIGLPVIAALPLAALLFAYLALYIGAVCAAVRYCVPAGRILALIAGAAVWTLAESLREVALTGFPWFAAGYSQIPNGLFAGFAPLGGMATVNFALMLSAALLAAAWQRGAGGWHKRMIYIVVIGIIIGAGGFGKTAQWTTAKGEVSVSLLQGNVKQELKWKKEEVRKALWDYLKMAKRSEGRIIILPETALPMTRDNLPTGYFLSLKSMAEKRNGAVIAGMFEEESGKTYNAAIATGDFAETSYRKRHLTPYGEYLPLADITGPLLRREWMAFFGLSPGLSDAPLRLPFADIGIAICYEDIFGGELRGRMAKADFLANLTNDGWFDGSMMAAQHLRYSQARALESGRDIVRATNTGVSAFINHRGEVVSVLPPQEQGILEGRVQLRKGATPFALYGDAPVLLFALLFFGAVVFAARKKHGGERGGGRAALID